MWRDSRRHFFTLLSGIFVAASALGRAGAQVPVSQQLKYVQQFTNQLTSDQLGQRITLLGSPSITETFSDKFIGNNISQKNDGFNLFTLIDFSGATIRTGDSVRTGFTIFGQSKVTKTDWTWTRFNKVTGEVTDQDLGDPSFNFQGNTGVGGTQSAGAVTITIRNDSAHAVQVDNGRVSASHVDPGLAGVDVNNIGRSETPLTSVDTFVLQPGDQRQIVVNVTGLLAPDPATLQIFFRGTMSLVNNPSGPATTQQVIWANPLAAPGTAPPPPPHPSLLKEQSVGGSAFTTSPLTVSPGSVITYRLTLANPNSVALTNATVTDFVPANTTYVPGSTTISSGGASAAVPDFDGGLSPLAQGLNVGTLKPFPVNGYFRILTFQVRVNAGVAAGAVIRDTATAVSDQAGDTISSNEVLAIVQNVAALAIAKTANPASVPQGGTTTFTITVTNNGSAASTNTIVTDTLPSGMAYVANSTTVRGVAVADVGGTSPLFAKGGLNIDGIPAGSSAVVTFRASIADCPAVGTQFTDTASVVSDQTTSVSAQATITTTADQSPPTITITSPAPGATFTRCDLVTVLFNISTGCNTLNVNSIVVRVGGVAVPGTLVNLGNGNFAFIITDLTGVPIGPTAITVTASTTTGLTATATQPINIICSIPCAIELLRRAVASNLLTSTEATLIQTSLLLAQGAGSTAARCEALRCALCFIRSAERRSSAIATGLTALDQEVVCLLASCPASTRVPTSLF